MARLFVVLADGKIPELGGIRGPITKPTAMDVSTVIEMVNRGLPVEEVNPSNHADRVKMTFGNIHSNNFVKPVKKVAAVTPQEATLWWMPLTKPKPQKKPETTSLGKIRKRTSHQSTNPTSE